LRAIELLEIKIFEIKVSSKS